MISCPVPYTRYPSIGVVSLRGRVFRINVLMNAWKRILEIGFIWTRDIGAAFAARSLLGATCWRAGRDGFAKTSSITGKKGGQKMRCQGAAPLPSGGAALS